MRKVFLVATALIALIMLTFTMTASHWWKRCSEVIVTFNGRVASDVNVYCSSDGLALVYLRQGEDMYVVNQQSGEVGVPNRSSFFVLPGYAYSRNVPPLTAPMGKAEVDPQLIVAEQYIEFNSSSNGRVRVTW